MMPRTHHQALLQLETAARALERIGELAAGDFTSGTEIHLWVDRALRDIGSADEVRAEAEKLPLDKD